MRCFFFTLTAAKSCQDDIHTYTYLYIYISTIKHIPWSEEDAPAVTLHIGVADLEAVDVEPAQNLQEVGEGRDLATQVILQLDNSISMLKKTSICGLCCDIDRRTERIDKGEKSVIETSASKQFVWLE